MPGFLQPAEGRPSRMVGSPEAKTNIKDSNVKTAAKPEKDNLQAKIKTEIVKQLGRPTNLLRIDVITVGHKCYRANVICKNESDDHIVPTISRPHSYYVRTTDGMEFSPTIVKLY